MAGRAAAGQNVAAGVVGVGDAFSSSLADGANLDLCQASVVVGGTSGCL
jgi:hypothetical protein